MSISKFFKNVDKRQKALDEVSKGLPSQMAKKKMDVNATKKKKPVAKKKKERSIVDDISSSFKHLF